MQKGLACIYSKKPLYVWGSGFLYPDRQGALYRKNLIVCALRGNKSKQKLSELTGKKYENVVLGDAGLLVDLLLDKPVKKKHRIGIINYKNINNFHLLFFDNKVKLFEEKNTILSTLWTMQNLLLSKSRLVNLSCLAVCMD